MSRSANSDTEKYIRSSRYPGRDGRLPRRHILKKPITLRGESDGKIFERTFTIGRMISQGADGICYEAYHEKSGKGVLKEFYPVSLHLGLERTDKGNLVHTAEFSGACNAFVKRKEEFIKPYEMLLALKQGDSNGDLSTFIPAFELYQGTLDPDGSESTVYVWTPVPELETFSRICDDIHKHPDVRPEYMLFTVLKAIETLTKCICSLHSAEIIHRDIKPSNFGFRRRGNETLTQSLSMFDIDSLCSVWSENNVAVGTEGYQEMEAGFKPCTNQTDIYSIGATLFTAIIVTEESRKNHYRYDPEFYNNIKDMVRESELIKASERNSDPRLRDALSTILSKCLCGRARRYRNCEALLDDIERALFYILPPGISSRSSNGEKWVLAKAEKTLDANKEKNSSLGMMYHLFEHPLYRHLGQNEEQLNIVVAGLGFYGQKFLDICLQEGQLPGRLLNVYVLSDNINDCRIYLSERPELRDFFDIEDMREGGSTCFEPYGRIFFDDPDLTPGKNDNIPEQLEEWIRKADESIHIHYIFTDLGSDKVNARAASVCRKITNRPGRHAVISYASEETRDDPKPLKGAKSSRNLSEIRPVYVNADSRKSEFHAEIERMAFNTHLVWEKNLNLDFDLIRKEFQKPYNHDASVSNVLSMKYKLFSLGIDLDKCTFAEAAGQFFEKVCGDDAASKMILSELIWIEHRRWVTEKLCSGWTRMTDLRRCIDGSTKDEKEKLHTCIVRSDPGLTLPEWAGDDHSRWNTATEEELNELDELDRLSVDLHRLYARKAKEIRRSSLGTVVSLAEIRLLTSALPPAERETGIIGAFGEWYDCIRSIWEGDRSRIRLYRSLMNNFLKCAENLGSSNRRSIEQDAEAFNEFFYPVLACEEYKDWKQNDIAMVASIPFVLTYSEKMLMAIPFRTGNTAEDLFIDVAAPVRANPDKLFYIYLVRNARDAEALENSAGRVVAYLKGRKVKGSIEFIVIHDGLVISDRQAEEIIRRSGAETRMIIQEDLDEREIWTDILRKNLKDAMRGRRTLALQKSDSELPGILVQEGLYDEFDWYTVDTRSLRFDTGKGCDVLRFITRKPHMTVSDMMTLAGTGDMRSGDPEFFEDYEDMWARFCEDPERWRASCSELGALAAGNDLLASVSRSREGSMEQFSYILPGFCSTGAVRIINRLKQDRLIGKNSMVLGFSADSCKVIAEILPQQKDQFDRMFSNTYALALPDSITFTDGDPAEVRSDMLSIQHVGGLSGQTMDTIGFFRNKGYLISIPGSADSRGLTFGSHTIKRLLTDPQRIISLHVYHTARSLGEFNDVAICENCGPCICIMTRGVNSYFAGYCEDPAQRDSIEKELRETAERTGINAVPVVLTGTEIKEQLTEMIR